MQTKKIEKSFSLLIQLSHQLFYYTNLRKKKKKKKEI